MTDEMTGQNENAPATRSELHSVKAILQSDVLAVKTTLQDEILAVKTSFQSDLRSVEKRLDGRMDGLEAGQTRIMVVLSQVVGSLHDLRTEMRDTFATKFEVRELRSQMDGFAGQMTDFRRQWSCQSDGLMGHEGRLNDHERRLQKLEPRPE